MDISPILKMVGTAESVASWYCVSTVNRESKEVYIMLLQVLTQSVTAKARTQSAKNAPTRGTRRSIDALTVQSDCLRVVQQHPTRGQCTALPGRSCNRAVTIARPLSRLAEPPSSPAVASAPASAMPSSRSSRVRTWRRPSAAEYVPSAMSCPICCTAAPAASREVAGPSRALLLYLWCSAPMEKPFLPLGICCARRSRRQKASVAL